MKRAFLTLLVLFMILPYAAFSAALSPKEAVNVQKQRIDDIEKTARRERELILENYERGKVWLDERAEKAALRFSSWARRIWVEFFHQEGEAPYADGYYSLTRPSPLADSDLYNFRLALEEIHFVKNLQDLLQNDQAREMLQEMTANPQNRYERLVNVQARGLLRQMRMLKMSAQELKKNKEAELQRLDEWQKQARGDVRKVIDDLKSVADEPALGMVGAVSYGSEKRFVMIEGAENDIVYEGQVVDGVRVVEISEKTVEFSKAGLTWTQEVGEQPSSAWK